MSMQYFYLKTESSEGREKARIGGMYRHDIILSFLPGDNATLLLKEPPGLVRQAAERRLLGKASGESDWVIEGAKKAEIFARMLGPGRALTRERMKIFVFDGPVPEGFDPAKPEEARAAIEFRETHMLMRDRDVDPEHASNEATVSGRDVLKSLVARGIAKLASPHLRRKHRIKLWENAPELLVPAVDGALDAASDKGITINNFPGPYPGLCTLWFVKGSEMTLARRTEIAQHPPALLDIGEITLRLDWTAEFKDKSSATPELFAAYLRLGVSGTKAMCGCISLLLSGLLGIIPAAIIGGKWWYLPAGCMVAMAAFVVGSRATSRARRRRLDGLRRKLQETKA